MRLIDADKALEQINEWLDQTGAIPLNTSYHFELLGCVEDCPTIDAAPVVRGEWIYEHEWKCSSCGWAQSHDFNTIPNDILKYCPNCGAKMEVEP